MKYCPQCRRKYSDDTLRLCQDDRHLLSLEDPYNLVGRTLGNKYLIEALVGLGGMGAVYAAQHTRIDKQVAFKILQPNFAIKHPVATEMFEAEARTAGRLKHENIVEILDADHIENVSYIAMEWLEGHTLEEELAAEGPLKYERAAWILRQIAAALDAAHTKRTIHRDLKPSNVMIVKRADGSERVKVLDFGIGKVLGATAGSTVSREVGTPHYACPEQFSKGSKIDVRADVYSLGVVLFEMLTGKLPFMAESLPELIHLQLTAPPSSLRGLRPDAPFAIEELVMRMLAKNPTDRLQRAGEAAALYEEAIRLVQITNVEELTVTESPLFIPTQQPEPTLEQQPRIELATTLLEPKPEAKILPALAPVNRSRSPRSFLGLGAGVLLLALIVYFGWQKLMVVPFTSFAETLPDGVKLEMVRVPGGEFQMGSSVNEVGRFNDEGPQHSVNVSAFAISKYEITEKQWKAVVGIFPDETGPSSRPPNDEPIDNISWNDAQAFCKVLSRVTGRTYRLPSEAEWEYACKAGATAPSAEQKQSNAFGINNMFDDPTEWCEDVYHDSYGGQHGMPPKNGSAWVTGGDPNYRVIRGEHHKDEVYRATRRGAYSLDTPVAGFRVVLSARTP